MTKILIYRGFLKTKYIRTYNVGAQTGQKPVKVPKTGKIRYKYEKEKELGHGDGCDRTAT